MELQLDQACCGNEHGAFSSSHPQMLRYACGFKIANEFWESLARRGVTMDNSRPRYAGLAALPRADGESFGGEVSFRTSLSLHITRSPRRRRCRAAPGWSRRARRRSYD